MRQRIVVNRPSLVQDPHFFKEKKSHEPLLDGRPAVAPSRGLSWVRTAGSSRGSSTTSAITSRVVADVVVLGPPRVTAKNNTYLDVAVLSVNAGEGTGRRGCCRLRSRAA